MWEIVVFGGLYCFFLCSPLLCYRFVSTTLTAQIPTETLSQSHRLCFMLLHYHYVSTSLTMQIPTETLSQTHRVCFMLLCYRFVTTTLTTQIPTETLSQSHRLFIVLRFCAIVSLPLHLPHKFLRKRYRKQKNKIRNCLLSIMVDRYVGILFLPVS